jgi:predicted secreted Zn-dependent protease
MANRSTFARGFLACALLAGVGCATSSAPRPPGVEGRGAAVTRPPHASDLKVQVEERFYTVSGLSAATLNRALLREGPTVRGRRAHGLTEWRVSWSYVPLQRGSTCSSSHPRVDVSIVTTLPRWPELSEASERLARDWSLFLERLRHHESEHQDIAMKSGRALLSVLEGLEAVDCERLQAVAERAAAGLASRQEALHARFDVSSDYGVGSLR